MSVLYTKFLKWTVLIARFTFVIHLLSLETHVIKHKHPTTRALWQSVRTMTFVVPWYVYCFPLVQIWVPCEPFLLFVLLYIYIYVTYCFIYLLCFLSSVKTSLQTQCMSFLYVLNCIALFCPYFQCVHSLYLRGKYTLKRGLNLKRSVKRILVLITCVIKFWKKIDWENLCITCGYVYITCMLV